MKQRYLLWIILCAPFLLTWCFEILDWDKKVEEESKYPVAEQVCRDNGWEVTTDEEWTPICLLWGRWINLEDMEEHPEEDEDIDEISDEDEGIDIEETEVEDTDDENNEISDED